MCSEEKEVKRDSFVFYKSFYDAAECLPDANKAAVYKCICEYALFGIEPTENGVEKAMLSIAKPLIDKSFNRYNACVENGSEGGRAKTKTKPNENQSENQSETKVKPNPNLNVNVNVNVNDNVYYNNIIYIVELLNKKAGTKYKPSSRKTKSCIHARLSEGYSVDDFETVINKKCAEWLGKIYVENIKFLQLLFSEIG